MAELEFRTYNTQTDYVKLVLIASICGIETIANFAIVCFIADIIYLSITEMHKETFPLLTNDTNSIIYAPFQDYSALVIDTIQKCLYLISFSMIGLLMYYLKESYLGKYPKPLFLCKWIVFICCVSAVLFVLLLIPDILIVTKPMFEIAVLISIMIYFIYFIKLYKVLKKRHKESILFDPVNKTKQIQTKIIYRRFFLLALVFGILAVILWLYTVNDVIEYTLRYLNEGDPGSLKRDAFNIISKYILFGMSYTTIITVLHVQGTLLIFIFGLGFDLMSFVGVTVLLCLMFAKAYNRRKRTYRYKVGSIDAYERVARARLLENGHNI